MSTGPLDFKIVHFGPVEMDRIYREIGRFIFEFSQLEYTLRHWVAEWADVKEEYFNIVTSGFDFAKLCDALRALSTKANAGVPDPEIERLVSDCMKMNQDRVRVAHGLWVVGAGHDRVIHTSRNSMKSQVYFDQPGDLESKADRCNQLRSQVDHAVQARLYNFPIRK